MGSRLWTALLLLAAVVAGHGAATCVAAAPAHGYGITSPAGHAPFSPVAAVDVAAAGVAAPHDARAAHAPDGAGPGMPWHDLHVVAACLAALLAGIAALRALTQLRVRTLPFGRGSPEPAGRASGRSRRRPAPDLSVLCLLRI